jgi:uncharacterized damage-inducible protein DinB
VPPDPARANPETLLAVMASGHARLLDVVRRADASGRVSDPGACGAWSVRDVFAHVVVYQRWIAIQLGAPLEPMPVGPPEVMADQERRTAHFHEALRDRSLADLLRDDETAYAAIWERVAALSEIELRQHWEIRGTGAVPAPAGAPPPTWALWHLIDGETAHHYEEHAAGLAAWLAERATC